ncbi:hypothetical protein [Streptomyces sp. NPDC021020]|uniref:hypothetical protein n=1 Tax=Streptomyces sp. NPDC021020 TaxID=3365109 RepID=UPI0037AD8B36
MIGAFDGDRTHLRGRGSYCRGQFAQHGLDTGAFGGMLGICRWLDDESPDLKRRENLAAAVDAGAGPGARMVQIPEPVTETYAQADGKKLAQQFNGNDGGDSKAGDEYQALAQELLTHQDDPDANLTPSEATTLLASTRSKTADTDLTVFSHALGTAPRAQYLAPGFDKVVTGFTTPVPKGAGTFPSDFLAKSTRANGLDLFADDHSMHLQGDPFVAKTLGLPQNTTTLDLQALSTDEAATQQAFATMGQDGGNTDLNGNLKALADYARDQDDPELTAAFQSTLDAGAGNRPAQRPYGSYCAPVLQGKPTGQTWCRGGKVTLRTSEDWTQFDRWTRSGALTDQQRSLLRNLTSDASAGYDDGTMWRTPPGTVAVERHRAA